MDTALCNAAAHQVQEFQFWLKLNLGFCLEFFRAFLECVFLAFLILFAATFPWIGFLCFLASHRIALLFSISLSSTEFFNLS